VARQEVQLIPNAKEYKAGDTEGAHYHKVATELTVIVTGAEAVVEQPLLIAL